MKFLSLDLEGVLIVNASALINPEYFVNLGVPELTRPRNHYYRFLLECHKKFDEIYMNTCVDERRTRIIMNALGLTEFQYLPRNPLTGNKMVNLEKLAETNLIIHVEDGISEKEKALAEKFGIHYIGVKSYDGSEDEELLRVLEDMDGILNRNQKDI